MGKERGRRSKQKEVKKEEKLKQEAPAKIELDQQIQTPFFGLVDSNELDYFKSAESTLNINAFEDQDTKAAFISSVIEESRGKELKLVTNQICSKLMERLILNSNDLQLKHFFKIFNGHFASLAHHKYASHCLETLFVRSAALVEKELLGQVSEEDEEDYVTMENLFLYMCGEVRPYVREMTQHQYASHVLRLIILILSGRELPSSTMSNSLLRSKKSKIARKMIEIKDTQEFNRKFQIPTSFMDELKSILVEILKDQDTKTIRELCINAVSSPTYSLILSIEGLVLKERPYWDLVFSPQDQRCDSKEELFIEYCLSDPIGSHFLEIVLKQARLKSLEKIFENFIKDRVLKIANREKTGSFIISVLLTRLKSENLFQTLDQLIDNLSNFKDNHHLVKSVLTICQTRKDYRHQDLLKNLVEIYPSQEFLESVLHLSSSTLGNTKDDWPTSIERQDSLYCEFLFDYDPCFINFAIDEFLSLDSNTKLIQMCKHGVFSHVIEKILLNFDKVDTIKRRKFLNLFLTNDSDIVDLACNSNGSHIVDLLWKFTIKLNNYKERISLQLINNKDQVKNSTYGKLVWKNWSIDMFLRKKMDWKNLVRDQELEAYPKRPLETDDETPNKKSRQV